MKDSRYKKLLFTKRDYITILRKYRGLLLFRGKSSISYKFFDNILLTFKKKFKTAPAIHMFKAIYILLPLFGFLKHKIGYKIKSYPALINLRKRISLVLKWLVRDYKKKIYVRGRGYDIDHLANIFIQASTDDGRASISAENYKEAIVTDRFNLKKTYGKRNPLLKLLRRDIARAKWQYRDKRRKDLNKGKDAIKKTAKQAYSFLADNYKSILPTKRRTRKYYQGLFKVIKFNPKSKRRFVIKEVDKRFYLKFRHMLKRIIFNKGEIKLKYLKWFAFQNNIYFDWKQYKTKQQRLQFLRKMNARTLLLKRLRAPREKFERLMSGLEENKNVKKRRD